MNDEQKKKLEEFMTETFEGWEHYQYFHLIDFINEIISEKVKENKEEEI